MGIDRSAGYCKGQYARKRKLSHERGASGISGGPGDAKASRALGSCSARHGLTVAPSWVFAPCSSGPVTGRSASGARLRPGVVLEPRARQTARKVRRYRCFSHPEGRHRREVQDPRGAETASPRCKIRLVAERAHHLPFTEHSRPTQGSPLQRRRGILKLGASCAGQLGLPQAPPDIEQLRSLLGRSISQVMGGSAPNPREARRAPRPR